MAQDRRNALLKHSHEGVYPEISANETITGLWEFAADVEIHADLRITDAGGTDYLEMRHGGTNMVFQFANTDFLYVQGLNTGVLIRDGSQLRIYDAGNTDYLSEAHDGTDFASTFVNTGNWTISGLTGYMVLSFGLDAYANDTEAAAGGVPLQGLYRNGGAVRYRVT